MLEIGTRCKSFVPGSTFTSIRTWRETDLRYQNQLLQYFWRPKIYLLSDECRLNHLRRIAIVCNSGEICVADDLTKVVTHHLCPVAQHLTRMMEVQHIQLELRDTHINRLCG